MNALNNNPGYNEKRFLSDNRFSFNRVTLKGIECIEKQANFPELRENLNHEILWSKFMGDLSNRFPEIKLRAPKIYDIQSNKIVFEYINAPLLCEVESLKSLNDADFKRFVQTFEIFDMAGDGWKCDLLINDFNEHTPYNNLDKSWDEWFKYVMPAGLINDQMANEARRLVRDYEKFVTPRMQHGDYKLWQIFDNDGEWIVFDGEHSSQVKPRYYDLAYMYARTFVIGQDEKNARRLLNEFLLIHDRPKDDFFNAFTPVLMSRSMGMFLDAFVDIKKGNRNYVKDANRLFEICTNRSLESLV